MRPETDWNGDTFRGRCQFLRPVGGRFGGGCILQHPSGFVLVSRGGRGVLVSTTACDGFAWILFMELGGRIMRSSEHALSFRLEGPRDEVFHAVLRALQAAPVNQPANP